MLHISYLKRLCETFVILLKQTTFNANFPISWCEVPVEMAVHAPMKN